MTKPHFALLLPGIETAAALATLLSLRNQLYPNWTLYLPKGSSGASPRANVLANIGKDRLSRFEGDIITLPVSENLFVLPLVPGDELLPEALAKLALLAMQASEANFLYGDHAEHFGYDHRVTPFFKPGWSPEFLVATDYIGRAALEITLFNAASLPSKYDALDLWALWLATSKRAELRVERVQGMLMKIATPALDFAKAEARGEAIVDAHLRTLGVQGNAKLTSWARRLKALAYDLEFPDSGPKVSILIPTKNNYAVLKRCLDSLKQTSYSNFEIVVIDNASDEPRAVEYLQSLSVRVVRIPSPATGFSYSYVNNAAVKHVDGYYLLFLNDDTEVIRPDWLSQMVGWANFPNVASVGARLYFPDDLVQHCGLIHNLLDGGLPAPAFKLTRRRSIGTRGQDRTVRNYSAVTAACMLTPRQLFVDSGGFNDTTYSVAYNDCDYGFRLTQVGLRHVCVPTAELYHHEGASRGRGRNNDKLSEEVTFVRQYKNWADPYYNDNLSPESFEFEPAQRAVLQSGMTAEGLSVALFSHNLNLEGAPLVLLDIARGLRLRGARVVVISLIEGPLRALYEADDCEVIVRSDVGIIGAHSVEELQKVLDPIINHLRSSGADVVIANTVICHWGMEAARLANLPALWIVHESEPPHHHLAPHGNHHVEVARHAFDSAYLNIFVAASTRELYAQMGRGGNSMVIHNGFDHALAASELARFDRAEERAALDVSDSEFLFLLPGTVCERKAQHNLVSAIDVLPGAVLQRCRFVIVGDRDGPYSRALKHLADELPGHKRTRLTIVGETQDIWRYYKAADGLVFTSHLESFPRVIQEAMYCGLPIITTPVFGISEQLRDRQSALFFPPGDIAALSKAITLLMHDDVLRERLGKAARLSLDRFPTIEEMQAAYCTIVAEAYVAGADVSTSEAPTAWLTDAGGDGTEWWNTIRG